MYHDAPKGEFLEAINVLMQSQTQFYRPKTSLLETLAQLFLSYDMVVLVVPTIKYLILGTTISN